MGLHALVHSVRGRGLGKVGDKDVTYNLPVKVVVDQVQMLVVVQRARCPVNFAREVRVGRGKGVFPNLQSR